MLNYSHFFVIQKINFGYHQLLISILERNVPMVDDCGAADLFTCTSGFMFFVDYNVVHLFVLFSAYFCGPKSQFWLPAAPNIGSLLESVYGKPTRQLVSQ
jgi:hypothetical protein